MKTLIALVTVAVAALLVLVVVVNIRARRRSRRRGPPAHVSVVLRTRRSAFRINEMREVR